MATSTFDSVSAAGGGTWNTERSVIGPGTEEFWQRSTEANYYRACGSRTATTTATAANAGEEESAESIPYPDVQSTYGRYAPGYRVLVECEMGEHK